MRVSGFQKCLRALFGVVAGLILSWGVLAMSEDNTAQAAERDLENTLYIELPMGRVVIALRPDLAPNHVRNNFV